MPPRIRRQEFRTSHFKTCCMGILMSLRMGILMSLRRTHLRNSRCRQKLSLSSLICLKIFRKELGCHRSLPKRVINQGGLTHTQTHLSQRIIPPIHFAKGPFISSENLQSPTRGLYLSPLSQQHGISPEFLVTLGSQPLTPGYLPCAHEVYTSRNFCLCFSC